MYTASFYGDEEEYPRYSVGDVYPTQQAALLACEADLRSQAMVGRKYYNDLCYYDITEELEDGERGDTVNAAELPALTLPNLGDFVRFMPRRKALNGVIIALKADENYQCFWVAELLKNGQPSTDGRRRWLYHLRDLNKVIVYRRFTPLTPTPDGPTWERVVVPIKEKGNKMNTQPFEETVQVKIVKQRNGRCKAIYRSLLVDGTWDRTWFRMNIDAARKGLQRGYAHVGIYPNVKVVRAEGSL